MTIERAAELLGTRKASVARYKLAHMAARTPLRYKVAAQVIIDAENA